MKLSHIRLTSTVRIISSGINTENTHLNDDKFDLELVDLYADRSEWMFHDTQINPNPVHASLPELKTLPDHIKKKMLLVHYPDGAENNPIDD